MYMMIETIKPVDDITKQFNSAEKNDEKWTKSIKKDT